MSPSGRPAIAPRTCGACRARVQGPVTGCLGLSVQRGDTRMTWGSLIKGPSTGPVSFQERPLRRKRLGLPPLETRTGSPQGTSSSQLPRTESPVPTPGARPNLSCRCVWREASAPVAYGKGECKQSSGGRWGTRAAPQLPRGRAPGDPPAPARPGPSEAQHGRSRPRGHRGADPLWVLFSISRRQEDGPAPHPCTGTPGASCGYSTLSLCVRLTSLAV